MNCVNFGLITNSSRINTLPIFSSSSGGIWNHNLGSVFAMQVYSWAVHIHHTWMWLITFWIWFFFNAIKFVWLVCFAFVLPNCVIGSSTIFVCLFALVFFTIEFIAFVVVNFNKILRQLSFVLLWKWFSKADKHLC